MRKEIEKIKDLFKRAFGTRPSLSYSYFYTKYGACTNTSFSDSKTNITIIDILFCRNEIYADVLGMKTNDLDDVMDFLRLLKLKEVKKIKLPFSVFPTPIHTLYEAKHIFLFENNVFFSSPFKNTSLSNSIFKGYPTTFDELYSITSKHGTELFSKRFPKLSVSVDMIYIPQTIAQYEEHFVSTYKKTERVSALVGTQYGLFYAVNFPLHVIDDPKSIIEHAEYVFSIISFPDKLPLRPIVDPSSKRIFLTDGERRITYQDALKMFDLISELEVIPI